MKRNQISILTLICLSISAVTLGQRKNLVSKNDTTYMLTYDHGGQILWGLNHFEERLKSAKDWLDKYPGFKIGLENEAHVYDYFAQKDPKMLDEIRGMLTQYKGRFGIGSCSYGQPLSTFINEESNVRQIKYALEAELKYFNYRPPVYLMSEHAMHSQVPQLLKGFDFQGAIMRTHFMMYGYNPTFNVAFGNWRGVDGTRIPTVPTYTGEGAEFGRTPVDNWMLTRYPGNNAISPQEYRKKFKHIKPLLASRADDSGLRKEDLVAEVNGLGKYQWILLDELLSKYGTPKNDLVTGPNDFTVRMPWGYCGNFIWNESRKAEVQVLKAERLAALAQMAGAGDFGGQIDSSWKNLLVGQHHDIQIVGLISAAKKYLGLSQQDSRKALDRGMKFFASNLKSESGDQVTIFNPLSWKVKEWIKVKIPDTEKGGANDFLVKKDEEALPVRMGNLHYYSDGSILEGDIYFQAELPPLSVTSYSIVPLKKRADEKKNSSIIIDYDSLKISTSLLSIKLAPEGGIENLIIKSTGESFALENGRVAYFEGLIDGVNCKSAGRWVIEKTEDAKPYVSATEYGSIGGVPYQFIITVFEDSPEIDCRISFDFNGQKIGLLSQNQRDAYAPFVHDKKLRFKFFPNLEIKKTFGVRDLPFTIAETNALNVEGNYWTALSDGRRGVAFFNKGNMGSIRENDGSFSIPLAYAMYYIWGTRMLNGQYTYEFSILPFGGGWEEQDLHRKALAYNFPVEVLESGKGSGKLGGSYKFFGKEPKGVILSAFYIEKGEPVMRLYEYQGKTVQESFYLNDGGYRVKRIEMDGRNAKQDDVKNTFTPWQIKTYKIIGNSKAGSEISISNHVDKTKVFKE